MGFKNLETYISDLLYRYNLVILPGFGALIGRRKPAKVNTDKGIFQPPAKEISFNGLIVKDDGLLINHIATSVGVPFDTAEKFVLNTISSWKNDLARNKRMRLENIGFFTKTNEKILFTPYTNRNYLTEAFGLETFVRKPLQKTLTLHTTSGSGAVERHIPVMGKTTDVRPFPQPQSRNGSSWIKYAAAAVIAVSLLWGGYRFGERITGNNNIQVQQATYQLPDRFPEIVIPSAKNLTLSQQDAGKKYYIIVGAFKNERNARKLVEQLRSEGVEASIPGRNPEGLYYVAYAGFASPEDAGKQLIPVGQSFKGAWILEK